MGHQLRMRNQMKVQTALETRQHLVSSQENTEDSQAQVSLSEGQPSHTGNTSAGAGEYEFVSPQHVAINVLCYSSK